MISDLCEIKRMRKGFGLTQIELSKLAGVSQSLIAKIESGRIDPTYTKTKRIFEVLDSLKKEKEVKASEIMVKRIIGINKDDKVKAAIEKMKKYEISQMPVFDGKRIAGLVTEATILNMIAQGKKVSGLDVREVMQDAPPIVSKKTPVNIIIDLLKYSPLVIISDDGKPSGVVTKSDVLKNLYKLG